MPMHINAKKVAVSGLLLALTEVCVMAGAFLESNTLFLLAAASYFVGIIKREFGGRIAAAFYLAGVFLGIFITPNKMYVLTYAAMGLYILAIEWIWDWLGKSVTGETTRKYQILFWLAKYLVFNILYIPAVLLMQELLFGRRLDNRFLIIVLLAGQIGLLFYDYAYEYVQASIWSKLRGKLF